MDYRMHQRKYLLECLGKLGEVSKQQQIKEYNQTITLPIHMLLFFSVSFNQNLVFPCRLCSEACQHILDIVGLRQAEV